MKHPPSQRHRERPSRLLIATGLALAATLTAGGPALATSSPTAAATPQAQLRRLPHSHPPGGFHLTASRPPGALHAGFRAEGGGRGPAARAVRMSAVPASRRGGGPAGPGRALPLGTGRTPAQYSALKNAARFATAAPRPAQAGHQPPTAARGPVPDTPAAGQFIAGQSDSHATCPYYATGCAPPDEALATSASFEVQAVNTSIAVWKNGVLQPGFPKNLQNFFGVPNPAPAGCDPAGPFLADPRAAYDPNADRFYVTAMQIEGGFGVGNGCNATSTVWFAVSANNNPDGAWFVYSLAIPETNATTFSDYTRFGFDTQGLYWSFNLFNAAGNALVGNVVFGIRKAELLLGHGFFWWWFGGLNVNNTLLDTINPVESLGHNAGPQGEIFVNSYNINSGGGNCAAGCNGLVIWDFSNIAFQGWPATGPGLSSIAIASNAYSLPPQADDPPLCNACLETLDTRISATPTYQHGQVYAALETAVNNGSGKNVPGILWFDINAYLNPGPANCAQCTSINGATGMLQQGYFFYNGATDAYFPTLIPDSEGNLMMGLEYSSSAFKDDPSQVYVGRRVTLPPGQMSDGGIFAVRSVKPSVQFRQGDYGASSWTGATDDSTWSAGEFSCAATGDWCTEIWRNNWTIND